MRIGIIGSGHIGATVARLLVAAGHDVAVANSRGPESLSGLVEELGAGARAETAEGAASYGELVLAALPFGRYRQLPAGALTGKVVIDATNYYPDRDGAQAELDDDATTSSELLAAHLPGAHVVKAFNTLYWHELRDCGGPEPGPERVVVFLAGDDRRAKERVAELVAELGFAPVDTGGLAGGGRRLQPGAPLSGEVLTEQEAAAALE